MFAPSSNGSRRPSVVAGPSTSPYTMPPPASLRLPPQPRPRGNSHSRPHPPPQTQPTTIKLSPVALRSFFHRLTHPPSPPPSADGNPASKGKGKERPRWWSGWRLKIQPEYDVKLDDVLDRKHLPPLGLKDFEEWLLFVEGTSENLYFILWLREYTNRYTSWTTSLRLKQNRPLTVPSSLPTPLTSPTYNSQLVVPPERERPFASLGMAMSSLSLAPPSPARSQAPNSSYPTFTSPFPNTPLAATPVDNVLIIEESDRNKTGYRTQYAPSPNPDLAMFYLRAKETFLTPNAEYELDVSSEVLSVFHVGSANSEKKPRRDSGVAFHEWERERRGRYGSHDRGEGIAGGLMASDRPIFGMSGTNMYPPDPAVFDELADIIQERLKASLARLVVATYNNVGMPRAYCGSAGGCAIALLFSAPPIIASFAAGGPRWYRLFALPGLWLGMTIFISAMYGVCMMIYVFGDLRQLRSFELARPPLASGDAKVTQITGDSVVVSFSPGTQEKERKGSVFTLRSIMGKNKSEDQLSSTAFQDGTLPFRKESLVPVVNPVPMLSMPARPRKAHTIGSTSVRSTSGSPPQSLAEATREAASGSERDVKPRLRLDIWGSESAPGSPVTRQDGGEAGQDVQVPPKAIVREGRAEDARRDVVIIKGHDNAEEDSQSDDDEDEDSGFDTGSDADDELDSSPRSHDQHHERPRHRHRGERSRPPPIEISEAFYDEHPSPEGPATAPADWFPHNLERLAAQNPVPGPSTMPTDNPLWPDFAYSQAEYERNETALFIRPFVYSGSESGSSCTHHGGEGSHAARRDKELEKGVISVDEGIAQVQAAQPMNEFNFDELPTRRPKLRARGSSGKGPDGVDVRRRTMKEEKAERLREQRRTDPSAMKGGGKTRRSVSPGSSVSASTNGKPERWYWAFVEWMQVKCGPKNMVDMIEKREKELEEGKGKGKAPGEEATMTQAQIVMLKAAETRRDNRPSPVVVGVRPAPAPAPVPADVEERNTRRRSKPSWRTKLRKVYLAVPAFAAPLTPVLNPLVGRAQWEIVVRSAAVSALLSCVVVGGLLGAPET
ncbi:hypothetical protein BC835DRAFT_1412741 [Cytidiella melzeri]|nr:hypothetical protein BC835DRAFT_1412741 [Cytidiella melzeri]